MAEIYKNDIYFIHEQDGKVEVEFKNALCSLFLNCSVLIRAYLARVKYDRSKNDFSVALCLKIEEEKNEESILHQSIKIFKSMFGTNEHLDIVFLSEKQEKQLREVCCPFFISQGYQFYVPDFYLISSEGYGLNKPIACFKRKHLYGKHPDGYLLCDINPPLLGQHYGMSVDDIKQIVLASRHQNYSISIIKEWPAYVHVAIPISSCLEEKIFIRESDIKLIAWAELYKHPSDIVKK